MSFLPIVDRELRQAGRRNRTYLSRTLAALGAIAVAGVAYAATLSSPPQQMGHYIFAALSGLCLGHGLIAGRRLTADCLSEEKREGTLGLLLLTELKGGDVVLGKLAATSLTGFYGLLAIFPVLAVPLLMGGVSYGEFWRMALALVNTFLFSLAVGIFVSSLSRDARPALAASSALLLLVAAAPAAMAGLIAYFSASHQIPRELLIPSPVYAYYMSYDAQYVLHANHYWWSVAVLHGATWLLIAMASWIVPRTFQDKPARPRAEGSLWRRWWHVWSFGNAAGRVAFRRRLLDVNAYSWLAARARLKPVHVWTFLGLVGCWWLWGRLSNGNIWMDETVTIATALILNGTLKLWVTVEAAQQLAEDRRQGALELLLSTPLAFRDIVRGQFLALQRQFLKPTLVVIGIELILALGSLQPANHARLVTLCLAGIIMLTADLAALSWTAMFAALTAKSLQHAIIRTMLRLLILPWLVFGAGALMAALWSLSSGAASPGWKFYLGLWFSVGLAADLMFGLIARHRLLTRFRELLLPQLSTAPSRSRRWAGRVKTPTTEVTFKQAERDGLHETLAKGSFWRTRKAASLVGLVVVLSVGTFLHSRRPDYPPPAVVSLAQTNVPFRVASGMTSLLLILPDGSLWRWGGPEISSPVWTAAPERVGTNTDWVTVGAAFDHFVGIRRDGTLWEWGRAGPSQAFVSKPWQVGTNRDWLSVSAGFQFACAIRRDGTLWTWGNDPAIQPANLGSFRLVPARTGTNDDWTSVLCSASGVYGIRSNGTLWAWGQIYTFASGSANMQTLSLPTQVCLETHWSELDSAWNMVRAWTRSGELWDVTAGPPGPDISITSNGRKILDQSSPGRAAFGLGSGNRGYDYEIRADGSLWKKPYLFGAGPAKTKAEWKRVGKRSDWVLICGWGTIIGLTSDGTVWTWGLDPTRKSTPPVAARLKLIQEGISGWFGRRPAGSGTLTWLPPSLEEPRPLMRLVPAESVGASNSIGSR